MEVPMIFVHDTLIGELKSLQQHIEKGVDTFTQASALKEAMQVVWNLH